MDSGQNQISHLISLEQQVFKFVHTRDTPLTLHLEHGTWQAPEVAPRDLSMCPYKWSRDRRRGQPHRKDPHGKMPFTQSGLLLPNCVGGENLQRFLKDRKQKSRTGNYNSAEVRS